ncbi:MAG TPA: FtsX-like permease family protein [Candidatus Cloacimonadota bacterium]|nr:FtsX-like permease family protein [Candidatus Cloacimonadota bacterium]
MNKLESFFLRTYVKHPKRNLMRFSFVFMVLGIVLSVAILSAGLNLFEGYERTLKTVLLDSFAHINLISSFNEYMEKDRALDISKQMSDKDEIISATPCLSYSAMVRNEDKVRGAMIRAYLQVPGTKTEAPYLKYLSPGYDGLNEGSVYIGHYMAKELGLARGDSITVIYPQLDRISMLGLMSSEHSFAIAGIYRSGYYEYDRSVLITTPTAAQSLLMIGDEYTKVELRLKPAYVDKAKTLADQYSAQLGHSIVAQPWTISSEGLFRLIKMEKWLIFIIFSFLVLIAGINVISAVITIIYDKKNEIAVLKTVGASQSSIKRLLFFRIALVGIFSIILGQITGALLSLFIVNQNIYSLKGEVYFIDRLAIHVSPLNQLVILAVSSALILLCILVPLRRIDRMQIIELLRNP